MTSAPTSGTKTDPIEYTVIVVTRGDGPEREFLMVRHADRGWELPGGKLEGKEGPVHCALREFREETGHLLADPKFVLKLRKENGTCFVFTGGLGPEVSEVDGDEAVETMEWFQRLPTDDLAFPDDPYEEMGNALQLAFR